MKKLITESEIIRIKSLHNKKIINEEVVITDWLSPDEKYIIFLIIFMLLNEIDFNGLKL
jgi:hypothetical protein